MFRVLFLRHGESDNNARPADISAEERAALRKSDAPLTTRGEAQVEALGAFLKQELHSATSNATQPPPPPREEEANEKSNEKQSIVDHILHSTTIHDVYCAYVMRALRTADAVQRHLNSGQHACTVHVLKDIHEVGGMHQTDPTTGEKGVGFPGRTSKEVQELFPHFDVPEADLCAKGFWFGSKKETEGEGELRAADMWCRLAALAGQHNEGKKTGKEGEGGGDIPAIGVVTHGHFLRCMLRCCRNYYQDERIGIESIREENKAKIRAARVAATSSATTGSGSPTSEGQGSAAVETAGVEIKTRECLLTPPPRSTDASPDPIWFPAETDGVCNCSITSVLLVPRVVREEKEDCGEVQAPSSPNRNPHFKKAVDECFSRYDVSVEFFNSTGHLERVGFQDKDDLTLAPVILAATAEAKDKEKCKE